MSALDDQLIEVPLDEPVVPVEVGEVIHGKYRIGRIIGFGGMATVAAGHHLELDQPIAIKFLHAAEAVRPDAVRRFLSEARAAARLSSPHVARVLDVGSAPTTHGGIVPFMVMELLDGMDLDAVVAQRGRLPVREAVEYVLQACAGVTEAHAMGIIHRDLKPGNLFLTTRRDGTPLVKLLDFGISKMTTRSGKDATSKTGDREMMGSPRYMSPEQVRSAKDVDSRTDIWALGVILHELLSGEPPFDADNVADTLVAILHAPPRSIAKRAPDVPADLIEVVMRCLQKKPGSRYPTVEAFAAALAPWRSEIPILVPPMTARLDDGVAAAEAGVSTRTVRASRPNGRLFVTVALTFAAVGLVFIAVVVFGKLLASRVPEPVAAGTAAAVLAAPPSTEEATPPTPTPPAPMPASTPTVATDSTPAPNATELPTGRSNPPPKPVTAPPRPGVAAKPQARPITPPPTTTTATAPPVTSGTQRHRTDW